MRLNRPFDEMPINSQSFSLTPKLTARLQAEFEEWSSGEQLERLWNRDASLWTDSGEEQWLGWLDIAGDQMADAARFDRLSKEISQGGFAHCMLIGMGGSSLCAEVFGRTFGRLPHHPELLVLDSTDPAAIRAQDDKLDLGRTLFIVSSKSGTTLESQLLLEYYFDRLSRLLSPTQAGTRFLAITDSGSALERIAADRGFRYVFLGRSDIGGRFSALSDFGLVPAAVLGLGVRTLLERAGEMVGACGPKGNGGDSPAVRLGILLGVSAKLGCDKLTVVASPRISSFGAWLEQLLAESTGKNSVGLIPSLEDALSPPAQYGEDRLFVYFKLRAESDDALDNGIAALEGARRPVIRIELNDRYDLAQEFFRWELATAVAGSSLGINPFDQPDVEASKAATRKLMSKVRDGRRPSSPVPILEADPLTLFAEGRAATILARGVGAQAGVADYLRVHLECLETGHFFAILAYLEKNMQHEAYFKELCRTLQVQKRVATTCGFGPRFLHSTGQAYKGGPNTGVFLQITADPGPDIPVPGFDCTFGAVEAAQAQGDFEVMARRDRRILRVHVGGRLDLGLHNLREEFLEAVQPRIEGPSG